VVGCRPPAIAFGVLLALANPGGTRRREGCSCRSAARATASIRAPTRGGPDLGPRQPNSRWQGRSLRTRRAENLVSAYFVLGPVIAKRQLGGPGAWAALSTVFAVGLLVGGGALFRIKPRRPMLVASVACLPLFLPTLLIGIPAPLIVIAAFQVIAGAGATHAAEPSVIAPSPRSRATPGRMAREGAPTTRALEFSVVSVPRRKPW